MWRGLYTAATGMVAETVRTDTIANNLANANTTGFKRDDAVDGEFRPMLLRRIGDHNDSKDVTSFKGFSVGTNAPLVGELGMGAYTAEVATDHAQGAFETTGNPLDVGISGEGYFAVETPQGVRYTRDGNFYRASDGRLTTSNGQNVLNPQGRPIIIPEETSNIIIGSKGEIYADRELIDQLQFVQFNGGPRAVLKQGDNLYYPQQGARPTAATGDIQQGLLERSNTNVVSEMVNLIANYRAYEANSKAVLTQDEMLEKSVTQVGTLS